jgi:DNA-binding MarR family transcriptional regulator
MMERMAPRNLFRASENELVRAAAFRAALRRFLARTDEVASAAGLTSQRYDLLLAIKTGPAETSTVTELSSRLSLRQTAVTELVKRAEEAALIERSSSPRDGRISVLALTAEGERRLLAAFVGLRDERRQLADAMSVVGASFRAFVHSQDEVAR